MSSVTATVRQGALRGKVTTTHTGKTYYSFQGIPYAKPPVGPLRFKPPEPAEPWTGVRDATKEGNVAPQFSDTTQQYMGDEDCLFLNVYTPQMPRDSSGALTPVMVWIHGGGYTVGSGNTDMYGPDYLLEHGVVVVTLNYRLGVLGFMSTGDSVVTGNMGLKDQVMALRWVKDNISAFGGDTDNITIFGESAGSRACHLHVLSPMAKGLFHRAICQSSVASRGSLDAPVAERTFRLAHHLGLKQGASSEELLAFMREVPARKLVEEMMHCRSQKDKTLQEMFPFRPTLEPAGTEGALITEDPADIISSGQFTPVPIIFGVTSQEGLIYAGVLGKKDAWRDLNANFDALVPSTAAATPDEKRAAAQEIRRFYLGDRPLGDDTFLQYAQLRGDYYFVYTALEVTRLHASVPAAQPVYFYFFDVETKLNIFKMMFGASKYKGAAHADDIPYLFRFGLLNPSPPNSVEGRVIARMTKLWTNFAKTGKPTPGGDEIISVTWPAVSADHCQYLEITNDGLAIKENLFKERMDFWDALHKKKAGVKSSS
ncbi:esterase E4-like isoform X1 [Schistocerca serialis cubense]|uniref:esterase E4-like isoform X1 n=1 Tax=Schistocerca serialis cubense TaxID=2023355 RepID=UPI00214F0AB9|nr:esterase E4-like isoform X1 [Schistocerca serialis cubense]